MAKRINSALWSCFMLFSTPLAYALDLRSVVQLPGGELLTPDTFTPGSIIGIIVQNAVIFAGVILLFLFVGGGFMVVSGGDNPEKMQKGQQVVVGSLIGFVVIVSAYWIVQIIEVLTGVQFLSGQLS